MFSRLSSTFGISRPSILKPQTWRIFSSTHVNHALPERRKKLDERNELRRFRIAHDPEYQAKQDEDNKQRVSSCARLLERNARGYIHCTIEIIMNKNVLLDPFRVLVFFFFLKTHRCWGHPALMFSLESTANDIDVNHVCSFLMTSKNLLFFESYLSR